MLFIWGRKLKRGKLGQVADFCPVCREFKAFDLIELKSVRHLYYIPLGGGQLLGHNIQCLTCGTLQKANLASYAGVSNDGVDDLRGLAHKTNPNMEKLNAKRVEVEQRLKSRKLTPDERAALIQEPFMLVNHLVEGRGAHTHFDKQSGLGLAAAVGLPVLLQVIGEKAPKGYDVAFGWAAFIAFLVAGGWTLYSLATDRRRYVAKSVQPTLVKALKPLEPGREELEAIVKKLKSMNVAVGKYVNPNGLHEALMQDRAPLRPR